MACRIGIADRIGRAFHANQPLVQPEDPVAEAPHLRQLVGHIDDTSRGLAPCGFQKGKAFCLKGGIPHGQNLVYHEHISREVRGQCKSEPHLHSAGIVLHGFVNTVRNAGKVRYDRQKFAHFGARKPKQCSAQKGVLASAQVGVESSAYLEQAGHTALDSVAALVGMQESAQGLEQGRFTCAVGPNDAQDFTLFEAEVNAAKYPAITEVLAQIAGFNARTFHKNSLSRRDLHRRARSPNTKPRMPEAAEIACAGCQTSQPSQAHRNPSAIATAGLSQ